MDTPHKEMDNYKERIMEQPDAIKPENIVILNENLITSTHPIGAIGQQRIVRTLDAPSLGGRSVLAVHLQPRGGTGSDNEVFAVKVITISSGSSWRANVLIARVDSPAGWAVDLKIDALWVTN